MLKRIAKKIYRNLPIKLQSYLHFFLSDKYGKKYYWAGNNYLWVYPFLRKFLHDCKDFKEFSIVEVGSRDCLDAIKFCEDFNPKNLFVFEPSRAGIQRCCEILQEKPKFSKNIIL